MNCYIVKLIDKFKKAYLEKYGKHFNELLCNYAISLMHHSNTPNNLTKEQVDKLLENAGITLVNNLLWDYVYIANMGYHDYFGSSISDELHLAKYIKDVLEDEDGYEGVAFCRWHADIKNNNIEINWEEMI